MIKINYNKCALKPNTGKPQEKCSVLFYYKKIKLVLNNVLFSTLGRRSCGLMDFHLSLSVCCAPFTVHLLALIFRKLFFYFKMVCLWSVLFNKCTYLYGFYVIYLFIKITCYYMVCILLTKFIFMGLQFV